MAKWSLDKIVIVGLVTSLMLTILSIDAIAIWHGDMSILALGKEILIGLFGYTSRGGIQAMDHKQSRSGEAECTRDVSRK